jgi:hypothetical protein
VKPTNGFGSNCGYGPRDTGMRVAKSSGKALPDPSWYRGSPFNRSGRVGRCGTGDPGVVCRRRVTYVVKDLPAAYAQQPRWVRARRHDAALLAARGRSGSTTGGSSPTWRRGCTHASDALEPCAGARRSGRDAEGAAEPSREQSGDAAFTAGPEGTRQSLLGSSSVRLKGMVRASTPSDRQRRALNVQAPFGLPSAS